MASGCCFQLVFSRLHKFCRDIFNYTTFPICHCALCFVHCASLDVLSEEMWLRVIDVMLEPVRKHYSITG